MVKRVAVTGALVVLGVFVAAGGTAWAHGRDGHPLWASPSGGAGSCRHEAPCSQSNAVSNASSGDRVIALPGVYNGGVVLNKSLDLRGFGAVIDATPRRPAAVWRSSVHADPGRASRASRS